MRILIVAPVPGRREGGVANVVHNVAGQLRKMGHDVVCLFKEDVLENFRGPSRLDTMYFALRIAKRVWRERRDFDVVNIHAPCGFAYGFLRRLFPARGLPPCVMTLHGIEERRIHAMTREDRKGRAWYFKRKNRLWHRAYHMPAYRFSILTADHSIVINRETWSMLQLKYGRETGRVWYIPNGVEERFFLSREPPSGIALRLLFVGTWLDHKGAYYLREAFEALAQEVPGVRLTIAGCLADAETVKRFFPQGVRDRVDVLPFVPAGHMPALYAQHDIFVFPSLMEGMPIALLEAMAAGMTVVTTETCGMMDVVQDDWNGLLVKPADSPALVAALLRITSSADLRARLGRAAQATARRYTWDVIARQVEKVFRLAAEQGERR